MPVQEFFCSALAVLAGPVQNIQYIGRALSDPVFDCSLLLSVCDQCREICFHGADAMTEQKDRVCLLK
jgi:hypothetical protein